MWSICKKEFNQFFSNLTGYIAIILFLLVNGIFLYMLPDSSIFEYGFASLDKFFSLAPLVLQVWISFSPLPPGFYYFLFRPLPCAPYRKSLKQVLSKF